MASLGDFAAQLITSLGGKPTPSAQKFFNSWQRWEGGMTNNAATWNPFNLTAPGSNLPTINSVGVVALPNERAGVQRTANLIRTGYPSIARAFATGQVNFADPGLQGDLNRWLSGKRTPGMTPYVSKIASAYGQGGLAGASPPAPTAPKQPTLPSAALSSPTGRPYLDQAALGRKIGQNFITGKGRIDILGLPGLVQSSMVTPKAPSPQASPGSAAMLSPPGGPQGTPSATGSSALKGIAASALSAKGIPYQWGGAPSLTKPTDCSGLLVAAAAANGIKLPRTTFDQFKTGTPVPLSQLQPGDAVFSAGSDGTRSNPGHVSIYIGNGKVVSDPHTGAVVSISNLNAISDVAGARRYA